MGNEVHVSKSLLLRTKAVQQAILNSARYAAEEYANGGGVRVPLVARHFTATNAQRYGFAPLTPAYAARKLATYGPQPILVASGKLKGAVLSGRARVAVQGGLVRITFTVPEYGTYLHEGTPKMPKRSPVEPNEDDRTTFIASAHRFIMKAAGHPVA